MKTIDDKRPNRPGNEAAPAGAGLTARKGNSAAVLFLYHTYMHGYTGRWHNYIYVFLQKHLIMADDKKNTGRQDDIRVDSNDPSEVEYVHSKFPHKTHEEVKDAIKQYGPLRKDIEDFLSGGK